MQLTENARVVLERRYLRKEDGVVVETPEDMFRRVAHNIAQVETDVYGASPEIADTWEQTWYDMMTGLLFLPNSPTLMNAGRDLQQLSACFVLPVEDSMEAIFDAIKNAALIHKSGGGTGFSFSRLRPKNDQVLSTGGVASGPVSFMKVFNAATSAVKQGGTRRGANMGILRVDHPDILEFIKAKEDNAELTNFNISVALTSEFMDAVEQDREYSLLNPRTRKAVGSLRARDVFDLIVDGAWRNGEPGIVFLDRINDANPTPSLGEIESTNPCGEQPLLPNESCNLGSINLSRMLRQTDDSSSEIDYDLLGRTVKSAVRFLDNVIDANRYPLPEIREKTKMTRKIGLGVMGFADMLIRLGIGYNTETAVETARQVMRYIRSEAEEESISLARERGSFPAFAESVYAGRLPCLRNATLTTVAPTGTISIIAGCSSGIEPLFAVCFVRNVMDNDILLEVNPLFEEIARIRGFYSKELMERVASHGSVVGVDGIPEDVQRVFVTAHDITPIEHVRIQAAFQEYTDNAVSKTVNLPNSASRDDVREVLVAAYRSGCKGVTVYRDGSRESQVLSVQRKPEQPTQSATQSAPASPCGKVEMTPRDRPLVTHGQTEKVKTGCGNVYVTVNRDECGLCEVFTSIGKSGGCASAQSEAISRLTSLALRSGVSVQAIIHHLKGIRCPSPSWHNGQVVYSCPDAIGRVLEHVVNSAAPHGVPGVDEPAAAAAPREALPKKGNGLSELDNHVGACPDCGAHMVYQDGCATCICCGYSRCG
jgi:ribonucleoside-diphosphate reductase alpha chain